MAPNSVAKFYLRSFIDSKVTGYTLGGDFLNPTNAVDRDLTTYAITSGKNWDVWPPTLPANAQFTVEFNWNQKVDTVFLRCNFAAFQIYVDNPLGIGSPVDVLIYANYENTSESVLIDLGALLAARPVLNGSQYIAKMTIAVFGTIIPNQEKKLTEFVITREIGEIPVSTMDNAGQDYAQIITRNLKNRSIKLNFYPNFPAFHCNLNFKNFVDLYGTLDLIKSYFNIDACLVYLYYSDTCAQLGQGAMYLVNDESPGKIFNPSDVTLNAGVDSEMDLWEV